MLLTIVAGAIVGSTAGAQDIESGVFRDLAATGRSRIALFGARVTGAWAVVLPIAALSAAAMAGASVGLAGPLAAPAAGARSWPARPASWPPRALSSAVAVGLSALIGSRGPVIAIVLAFYLAIGADAGRDRFLGDVRQAIPTVALGAHRRHWTRRRAHRARRRSVAVAAACGRRRLRRRRMAHQDPRDLTHAATGRGYAQRVSPALPRGCAARRPRMVDVALPPSSPCR